MITVSLCMIVKNEEKILGRCLDSVADLVDELIGAYMLFLVQDID